MTDRDFELLAEAGLTLYERRALVALMRLGVAGADLLCREGEVPSSKIYLAMEKLEGLGLAEIQLTRPKLYCALPSDQVVDRLASVAREKAERFASEVDELRQAFRSLPGPVRGRKTFVDLALGVESHVKRHLTQLSAARTRILSYLEHGDLTAIDQAMKGGFPILRRIARNTAQYKVEHRVVFGFRYQTAAGLVGFLRRHRAHLEQVTGVRYSGEMGHPFHVVDDEMVILCLDHPFIAEGRFASLLVRDRELAHKLADGFNALWSRAMQSLSEIDFQPRS